MSRPTLSCLALAIAIPALAADPRTLDALQVRPLGLGGQTGAEVVPLAGRHLPDPLASAAVDMAGVFDGISGVLARDRGNRAQDLQLSIRGFGARSTFGVRGIRVLADGLPGGAPDGQSQLTQFSPLTLESVEVVRGPFAALLGNASGGVVNLVSRAGQAGGPQWLQAQMGQHGERALSALLQGHAGGFDYRILPWYWEGDGYRDHARAERRSMDVRLDRDLAGGAGQLMLVGQHFDAPDALDPRALTDAEWRADPRQAAPTALTLATRKSVRQDQLGAVLTHPVGTLAGRLAVHAGQRRVEQFLAIPASAQTNPLHGGAVVDLDSAYGGVDARVEGQAHPTVQWQLGFNAERQDQHRRGWENHREGIAGQAGRLRRDQDDRVSNADVQAQLRWQPLPDLAVQAGIRRANVRFASRDHYITDGNPDDGGRTRYQGWQPMLGLQLGQATGWQWHAAAGRGIETPTFNELAYRADGGAGLALDLRAARSLQWETGLRHAAAAGREMTLTRFVADTEDELAVASASGGRTTYRNAGDTRRTGWEAALSQPLGPTWTMALAYTRIDARVRRCAEADCQRLPAGARLPGIARDHLQLSLDGRRGPWQWRGGLTALSAVKADDAGLAVAPGHAVLDAGLSRQWPAEGGPLTVQLSADNLLDRRHVAAVVINDANQRYYEPGDGRHIRLGLRWQW